MTDPPNGADLTDIDVVYRFRMYLVWRFPAHIIYTLATKDWWVVFRANTYVAGSGVTQIQNPDGIIVFDFIRSHDNPVVTAPTANGSTGWV
jgi:hypothetical protein